MIVNNKLHSHQVVTTLSRRCAPDLTLSQHSYYKNRLLKEKVDGEGNVSEFVYDDLSQLSAISYYTATDLNNPQDQWTYSYDQLGRITQHASSLANIAYQYTYNDIDVIQTTVNFGAFSKQLNYSYFENGQRKSYTNPESQHYSYQYDALGRIQTLRLADNTQAPPIPKGNISYTYNPQGLEKVSLPGGASIQQQHNVYAEKVASHYRNAAGNVLDQLTLTYSEQGNINHIQENAQENPQQVDLFYDEGQRLIGLKRNNQLTENYSYDQSGNRLSSKAHNNWTYNDYNQLTSYGSSTLTYNHNANQINDGSNTYHYNASNRLSEVKQNANTIATYRYDNFGRRISKTANNQTSYFLYDDTGLLAEYNAQGNLISEFAYHPDSSFMSNPLLTRQNNQLYFSHNDQTLASRTLYSQSGAEVWEVQNNGFTRDVIGNPTVINNLRFPGQYFDEETGTYYNYHRNYNPNTGRYIQSDPIGLVGGVNGYGYGEGNPLTGFDSYGLKNQGDGRRSSGSRSNVEPSPLTPCEKCWVQTQVMCTPISFGMGRMGVTAGSAIGSAIPGVGTAAGGIGGGIGGFIGGTIICNEIRKQQCSDVCDEDKCGEGR